MPGTRTPEPEPLEQVTLAHIAVAVEDRDVGGRAEQVGGGEVEAGRVEQARLQPLLVERLGELARRGARWRRSIAATSCSGPLRSPSRSSRPRQ